LIEKKKKILFIDHDRSNTGSTVSLCYLMTMFVENGWNVYLLTPKNGPMLNHVDLPNVKIITGNANFFRGFVLKSHIGEDYKVNSLKNLIKIFKEFMHYIKGIYISFKILRQIKPDLLYINEHVLCSYAISASFLNIPSVIHIRSQFLRGGFGLRNRFIALTIGLFNKKVFAISPSEAKQCCYFKKKVIVVPEFLDDNDYLDENIDSMNEVRVKLKLPIDKRIVIMLGGISRIKGTLDFISCIKYVVEKCPDVFFLLLGNVDKTNFCGDGLIYYNSVINQIKSDSVEKYICFIGHSNSVKDYILASDILVSTNTLSHFSRPIIEGWALKKAVVSTNLQHSLEYMQNGLDSLLVEVNSPKEISSAVIELLNNRELYHHISKNGYEKAIKMYSCVKNIKQIIDECLTLVD